MKELKNIKNIISKYQPEYNENDWLELEKKLPKNKTTISKKTIIISSTITAITIIAISSLLLLKETPKENNIYSQETESHRTTYNTIKTEREKSTKENKTTNYENIKENQQTNNNQQTIKRLEEKPNNQEKNNETKIDNNENKTTIINKEENPRNESEIKNNIETKNETKVLKENKEEKNKENIENKGNDINNIIFEIKQESHCSPVKVSFIAKNIPTNCEILWDFGNNKKRKANKIEYSYNQAGEYYPTVSVISNNFVLRKENLEKIQIYESNTFVINSYNENLDYQFSLNSNNYKEIEWTINNEKFYDEEINYNFSDEGNYLLTVEITDNNGCQTKLKENITVKNEQIFYFPTAFTPNSGNINSNFGPIGENLNFNTYLLKIFDKSGKVIFISENINDKWDGKINKTSIDAPADVYIWELKIIDTKNKVISKKGKVNLIR